MACPVAIGGARSITSIAGTFFVKLGANQSIMGALYKGFIASAALSLVAIALVIYWMFGFGVELRASAMTFTTTSLFLCGVVGLAVTGLIIWITEYYT